MTDRPNLPLNASVEERWVRALTDDRLAWSLDHLNERGTHSTAQKAALLDEAARRLRWGRMAEGSDPAAKAAPKRHGANIRVEARDDRAVVVTFTGGAYHLSVQAGARNHTATLDPAGASWLGAWLTDS